MIHAVLVFGFFANNKVKFDYDKIDKNFNVLIDNYLSYGIYVKNIQDDRRYNSVKLKQSEE